MVSSASISGLASGLDTTSIIASLMKLEAAPQARLTAKVGTEQSLVTTLQTLNTKASVLASKAAALSKPMAWTVSTATSTNASISATAGASAAATRLNITVDASAQTHQLGFATTAAPTDVVTGATTAVTLTRPDGSTTSLDTGDGTLQGLLGAINDPANTTGLTATAIRTGGGYRLLVESRATGAAQAFTLTQADGSDLMGGATVRAGTDARISLGAGITATSSSNTFADLVPGVSVTLGATAATGATTTIEAKPNTTKLSSALSDLVSSMNDLLGGINTQTAYDTDSKTAGPLAGDAGIRNLRTALLNAVYPADGTSLASIGIQTQRNGTVTFDADRFAAAYAADPTGVAARFTTASNGFAARLETVAKAASNSATGTITTSIAGHRSGIKTVEIGISDWDIRLALRKDALTRQFTNLETVMSTLSSQSSWLSSQIAALPSYS